MATKVICPHCSAEYDEAKDRRDRFAAAALTGMLSSWRAQYTEDDLARHAAAYTDAIIAELDKEQP